MSTGACGDGSGKIFGTTLTTLLLTCFIRGQIVRLCRASTLSLGRLFWYAAPVERGATAANGERAQPGISEVEAQRAKAGGAAKSETHGDQRLLSRMVPEGFQVALLMQQSANPSMQRIEPWTPKPSG